MTVTIQTFGYSLRDTVPDAVVIADVRDIPGIVVSGHEDSNGLDTAVQESVMAATRAQEHRDEVIAAIADHDYDTTVAVGCHQGRHRSVALAEVIADALRDDGHTVTTEHLDIDASSAEQASHRLGGHVAYNARTRYWGDMKPPKSKSDFFNAVTTPAAPGEISDTATIRIYGPIDSWGGWYGVSTSDIAAVIDNLPATITNIHVRLNSPGGEVSEAVAILNMLRSHRARITAIVDGNAASAASVIAAGCDETIMSPGSMLMIHSPWTYAMGNAVELRKAATTLDSFEATLIEIYQGKAGDQDWPALLAEETWLPAQAAVELGLADRTEVVPDTGEISLVGADSDDDDWYDATSLRVAASIPPAASASGTPTGKETAMGFTPDQLTKMRADLGLAPDADETAIASAVAARPATPSLPDGIIAVDAARFDEIQAQAAAGARASEELRVTNRNRIVDQAISDGKIAASRRDHYITLMDADPEGTKGILDSLHANTIPVAEIGYDGGSETLAKAAEEDAAHAAILAKMGITDGGQK